ncbi:MAG: flagellar protein FlaG [Shewanella sp.]|jgi:flagellar protein FlaG
MTMDVSFAGSNNAATASIVPSKPVTEPPQTLENESALMVPKVENAEEAQQTEKGEQHKAEELTAVAAELTDMMSLMRKGLAFKVDEHSGQNVVSVMDIDSGDVLRQIPNEEALELAKKLAEVAGFLLETEA